MVHIGNVPFEMTFTFLDYNYDLEKVITEDVKGFHYIVLVELELNFLKSGTTRVGSAVH